MCSILGYYNTNLSYEHIVKQNFLMSHRGPDNSTVKEYRFNEKKLFLGHNRLSIQDLATHANQPMENNRYVIVFNGEVYNHFEIRKKLNFKKFKTTSDTETLLWAFTEFGIKNALEYFIGMFSIALFDKIEQKLFLIRDRVGIKPVYWTFQNDEFAFSSELKGISSHLKQNKSNKALIQFMSFGYIPSENSYYKDIYKLKSAHYLVFDGNSVNIKRYWNLPNTKLDIPYEEAVEETERLIRSSVKYRLLSDVEVGSFLSGGIDSSLVSVIMQQESNQKIKTFSIGFEDKKYDESIYAKEVANYIHSEHFEYKFKVSDVINLIDKLKYHFDEPFGDASSLPMMILSEMTKKHVTVALSGDGGDELFLGYERYFFAQNYHNKLSKISQLVRTLFSNIGKYSPYDKLQKMSYPLKHLNVQNIYALLYCSTKPWELSNLFDSGFLEDSFGKSELNLLDIMDYQFDGKDIIDSLSRLDFNRYLSDDILTKVDRSTMAYGLEARVPILDHRVIEFAYSLPSHIRLQHGSKSILKEILYKQIPRRLIERPKRGFSVPLKYWFRNELKDIVYSKIENLDDRFNKKYLIKIFNEHQKGKNFEYVLWNIMSLR
ncbi:asparagine synthase (glutamine-hydrolyzing) [Arcobacter sp. KX21116]|uniref:asparagine synthase (glutamine-hydrolyzing) n=1 Tax=Arcobacter iocasae TaxID=2906515 RepID=UPI0035D40F12